MDAMLAVHRSFFGGASGGFGQMRQSAAASAERILPEIAPAPDIAGQSVLCTSPDKLVR
ncbi:hypothetical protein AABC73_08395 [Pseudomonas sp. G.S.17]|uniref:hypothetical protein n=1 Tax=Pseudomonas sp. G.S.17 TaxID=3137451 RepID=UPI00311CBA68